MEEKKKSSTKKKESKPRADKYEEKVSFDGTFDELLERTIQPIPIKEEDKKDKK